MWTIASIAALELQLRQGLTTTFDYFEPGSGDDSVCWGAKTIDGVTLIAFRGSVALIDWLRDLDDVPECLNHATLGIVNGGFMLGVEKAWSDIQSHTKPPWILVGHSLGAARSALLAGLMTVAGVPPLARVAFGEPKPAGSQLARIISAVPQVSYRNGEALLHDLVTDYPAVPLYVHPVPLTHVKARPTAVELIELTAFAWHHMGLYAKAVSSIVAPLNT